MRIVLIGQAPFGAKVFERLLQNNEEVVAVHTPPDKPRGRVDPLKQAALAKKIPLFQPTTYKNDEVFDEYRTLKPDLTILAFVTQLLPMRFLDLPTLGAVCYHPSILPRHRGANAINWALIMGDTRTGLTIFWVDAGIDTGPILLQKEVDIASDDTAGSLYFNHLFPMGVDAIAESVALIKAGKAPKIPQTENGATYEPPCDDRVAEIDWKKPAQEIYNLIRGCDPQPGAYSFWKGEKIRFYGTRLMQDPLGTRPGTVHIDSREFQVALNGGRLVVDKVRPQGGKKAAAAEFASEQQMKDGDRFGKASG